MASRVVFLVTDRKRGLASKAVGSESWLTKCRDANENRSLGGHVVTVRKTGG